MLLRWWRDFQLRQIYVAEALAWLVEREKAMTVSLQEIRDEIARDKSVVSSAVTLMSALKTRLDEVNSNTDLQVLKDDLTGMIQPLADAVAANTPGESSSGGGSTSGATGATGASSTTTGVGGSQPGSDTPSSGEGATGATGATGSTV